jgi:hypothetical protein
MSQTPRRPSFLLDEPTTLAVVPGFVRDGLMNSVAIRPMFVPEADVGAELEFLSAPEPTDLAPPPPIIMPVSAAAPPAPAAAPPAVATPPSPAAPPPVMPDALLKKVAATLERLDKRSNDLAAAAASDALELGIEVARRLIGAELSQRPELLLPVLHEAIAQLGESRIHIVKMHPDDLKRLQALKGSALGTDPGVAKLRLEADRTMSRGDLVVEADHGTVDATVEGRLRRIREALAQTALEPPP